MSIPDAIQASGGLTDVPPPQSVRPKVNGELSDETTSFKWSRESDPYGYSKSTTATKATVIDEASARMNAGKSLAEPAYFRHSSFRALAGTSDLPPSMSSSHVDIDKDFVFRTDSSGAIANPAPLGLFSFAFTTLFLSFTNADVAEDGFHSIVFAYALALGGIVQVLAGQWEFTKKNTFGAVAFSAYGAFWIGLSLYHYMGLAFPGTPAALHGMTIFMVLWGFFSFNLWLLTFKISVALNLTFFFLFVTFFCLAGGLYSKTVEVAAGWLGVITGFLAWYAAIATLANEMWGHEILPVGSFAEIWKRRAAAKSAAQMA